MKSTLTIGFDTLKRFINLLRPAVRNEERVIERKKESIKTRKDMLEKIQFDIEDSAGDKKIMEKLKRKHVKIEQELCNLRKDMDRLQVQRMQDKIMLASFEITYYSKRRPTPEQGHFDWTDHIYSVYKALEKNTPLRIEIPEAEWKKYKDDLPLLAKALYVEFHRNVFFEIEDDKYFLVIKKKKEEV